MTCPRRNPNPPCNALPRVFATENRSGQRSAAVLVAQGLLVVRLGLAASPNANGTRWLAVNILVDDTRIGNNFSRMDRMDLTSSRPRGDDPAARPRSNTGTAATLAPQQRWRRSKRLDQGPRDHRAGHLERRPVGP